MFRPLALYIGLRYTRAKKRNHFVSFIALASMIGIALGVTVLITVLSVMNGFDYEIRERIFSVARQVTITGYGEPISDWQSLQQNLAKNSEVVASAPFIAGQGMLSKDNSATGTIINGIIPEQEHNISNMDKNVIQGSMFGLISGSYGIVLGSELASNLDADLGDKVILITPKANLTPIGIEPRFKQFTVVGIFRAGEGFGYDSTTAFIHLDDAGKLFSFHGEVTGVNLKLQELYRAPLITLELANQLPNYHITNWTSQYGSFFKAIQMEKTTMFVVLMFIIAVAAFNLVSSLVMSVTDKQADIAILRTLGASPKTVMAIFIVQGGIIGLVGTALGILGGVLLAINAPDLVVMLEKLFHTSFISAGVYFIDYLPSKLVYHDIVRVGVVSLLMSLLATIYPAWRAAKTDPAVALRYE